jgi:transcriptional regulator with XRE-family HTH domain
MITAIREVRRAKGMTLDDVARACVPATTAQTIGRLETGTRTVSVAWLNRIAAALGVVAADLVQLPERIDVPVAAVLEPGGAVAPRRPATVAPSVATPGLIAVIVAAGVGDYRAGDEIWCERLMPESFASALNRDVLVPLAAGRFVFGRLIGHDTTAETSRLQVLPLEHGARHQTINAPPWIARAVRLSRGL